MKIWAIGDLHLSFGVEGKSMDVFGPVWERHPEKIEHQWRQLVKPEDLVLIPGDISWAMRPEQAAIDLQWIDKLPGTKVLIKGNHDYWWSSLSKLAPLLPPSIHLIQNNAFRWRDVAIGGARLWDSPEYSFGPFIEFRENRRQKQKEEEPSEKIFERELQRFDLSLRAMDRSAPIQVVMTHYPPIGADLAPSRASSLIEKSGATLVVFGHLHNVKPGLSLFGEARGVKYFLTSADYLHFKPICLIG
jgi:predicted phosphohydrolase